MTSPSPARLPVRDSKRRLGLFLVVLIVATAVLCLAVGLSRGPRHKGLTVSQWVDQATSGTWGNPIADQALEEVRAIGIPAIPYVIDKLQTGDGWRDLYLSARGRLPTYFQARLPVARKGSEIRSRAAWIAAALGSNAAPTVPYVARLLPGPGIDVSFIGSLADLGSLAKDALPALHSAVTNTLTSPHQQLAIADALWKIGRETNLVLMICTNAIVHGPTDGELGNGCAFLIQLGLAARPAVPFALSVLESTNHSVATRGNAAALLCAARLASMREI